MFGDRWKIVQGRRVGVVTVGDCKCEEMRDYAENQDRGLEAGPPVDLVGTCIMLVACGSRVPCWTG